MGTRWFSRRALAMHATLIVVVPTFLALCDWQVHRALSGNELSWAYVFEWPFFAGYAVYMWWKLVHDQDLPIRLVPAKTAAGSGSDVAPSAEVRAPRSRPAASTQIEAGVSADPLDEELAAYNRYLAALNANGRRKHW